MYTRNQFNNLNKESLLQKIIIPALLFYLCIFFSCTVWLYIGGTITGENNYNKINRLEIQIKEMSKQVKYFKKIVDINGLRVVE